MIDILINQFHSAVKAEAVGRRLKMAGKQSMSFFSQKRANVEVPRAEYPKGHK